MNDRVPDNWHRITLGTLGEVVGGGTPSRGDPECWDGALPWASPTDITALTSTYIRSTKSSITDVGLTRSSAKLHPAGSLLLTSRATVGYTAINLVPMATNQGFQSIRCGDSVQNLFLHYYLSGLRHELASRAAGSTFLEISSAEVKRFPVLLPPLPEQRKIAAILSSVDRCIEKTEAMIAKLQDLKKAMMQALLTKGLPPDVAAKHGIKKSGKFKDSPLGPVPEEWEVVRLEECTHSVITYGIVQCGPHVEGGIPYIRTGDMKGDTLCLEGLLCTSPSIALAYTRSEVHTSELVCAIRATIGKVLEVPPELDGANLTQGTARIAPKPTVNNMYLLWALRSPRVQQAIQLANKGTTFVEITLGDLRGIPVPMPQNRAEQDYIASALNANNRRVMEQKERLKQLGALKKALMQDLLTGEVRVTLTKAQHCGG